MNFLVQVDPEGKQHVVGVESVAIRKAQATAQVQNIATAIG